MIILNRSTCWCGDYSEAECHAEKKVCYLQGHGHSEGFYHKNMSVMSVSTVSSKLLILFEPNLMVHHHNKLRVSCGEKMDCCAQCQDHKES